MNPKKGNMTQEKYEELNLELFNLEYEQEVNKIDNGERIKEIKKIIDVYTE